MFTIWYKKYDYFDRGDVTEHYHNVSTLKDIVEFQKELDSKEQNRLKYSIDRIIHHSSTEHIEIKPSISFIEKLLSDPSNSTEYIEEELKYYDRLKKKEIKNIKKKYKKKKLEEKSGLDYIVSLVTR